MFSLNVHVFCRCWEGGLLVGDPMFVVLAWMQLLSNPGVGSAVGFGESGE